MNKKAVIPVALLGLTVVGLLLSCSAIYRLARESAGWRRARNWQPVPAQVLHAELEGRSKHGRRFCYTIQARYRYDFEGVTYIGTQTELDDSRSVAGQEAYRPWFVKQLQQSRFSQVPITCFVNPEQPQEAVLLPVPPAETIVLRIALLVCACGMTVCGMCSLPKYVLSQKTVRSERLMGVSLMAAGCACCAVTYVVFFHLAIATQFQSDDPGKFWVYGVGCLFGGIPLVPGAITLLLGGRSLFGGVPLKMRG